MSAMEMPSGVTAGLIDGIVSLNREVFGARAMSRLQFLSFLGSGGGVAIAEMDERERLVGVALLRVDPSARLLIESLAVRESARGRGFGARLLRQCQQAAVEQHRLLVARVWRGFEMVPGFFVKHGFRCVAHRADAYPERSESAENIFVWEAD